MSNNLLNLVNKAVFPHTLPPFRITTTWRETKVGILFISEKTKSQTHLLMEGHTAVSASVQYSLHCTPLVWLP